jgi:hypothetical protein
MLRIYVLAIGSVVVAAAGAVALNLTSARADWDETVPDAPLADRLLRVEWKATGGRAGQVHITGYVYNDSGEAAANVALRITGLDSSGAEVESVIRPVGDAVPGSGRTHFDVRVPRSRSYRVAVTALDALEPRGAE